MTTINVIFQLNKDGQTTRHAEKWHINMGRGVVTRTTIKDNQPVADNLYLYPQYLPGVLDALVKGRQICSLPLVPSGRISQIRSL